MALLCVIKEINYHLPKTAENPNQVEFYVVEFDQLTGTRDKYSIEPASELNLDVPKAILKYWKNRNAGFKSEPKSGRQAEPEVECRDFHVQTDSISPEQTCSICESHKADSSLKMDSDDENGPKPKRSKINEIPLDLNNLLTTPPASKSPHLLSLNNNDLLSSDLLSNFLPTSLHLLSTKELSAGLSSEISETFQREPGYNYQANQYKNKIYADSNYNKDPVTGKFSCGICGKDFVRRHDLFRHEKRHEKKATDKLGKSGTEFNPEQNPANNYFICGICGREFARKHDLYRHERRHLGVRPFQCSTCGKLFNESGNVKKHIKTAHGGIGDYTVDQRQLDDAKSALVKLTDEPTYLMSEFAGNLQESAELPTLHESPDFPNLQEHDDSPTLQENMNLGSENSGSANFAETLNQDDMPNLSVKREFQ
jgi:hypothetical protein